MKISFVITYYNQEQYVKQSLDSVLAINKPCDWEIIVGDDGSTDRTVENVKEYVDRYPNNIKLNIMPREKNKNYDPVMRASANRLCALDLASGDVFCVLDGDDFFCDTKFIADAIDIFEHCMNVSVVAFGYRYFQNGVLGEAKTVIKSRGMVDKKTYIEKFYIPAGGCVHKKCWDQSRTDYIKEIGYFDDNDILINSLNYGEMYGINRAIYAYRQTNLSTYNSMDYVEQSILNVLGFDVDKLLISEEFHDSLIRKNATSLITMYVWKRELYRILGEEKYNCLVHTSSRIINSTALKILKYQETKVGLNEILNKNIFMKKYIKSRVKHFISKWK